ncbi:MAG: hypothetical protein GY900_12420 [Actinomycetia bacterium]|jgi:hypothetical protein|nr:hypothetical protein [Actinomycetes bacterium]HJP24035.1 hypothetical protein [Acidimicrobiales bacterium]|tara:strand:+ start:228 stop:953 length:726 start_codon:yes stop_codon:yes gene_type:complete
MRTLVVMLLAGITVMAVLFFGLGGNPTDEIVILPVASTTLAPATTPTTDAANMSDSDTLIAVTTTVGMVEATLPTEPMGTLAPVEGLGVPTLNAASSVSTVGIDRVMFGMTLHDAQVAAGSQFTPITPVGHCFLVVPEAGQAGLTFWVVAGTVERVDVDTRTITTRSGAGIGDTEDRIRELFGERIHTTALPDGSGNLLAYVPKDVADATYRVMFLSNGLQITRVWAGRLPWAEEIGGCPG